MEAGKATIAGIFNGSRLLEIPFYQRSYVWDTEQWDRFLADMEYVTAAKRSYFLGSIILKQVPTKTGDPISERRTVIDGQQRLTTLILFFKAYCALTDKQRLFERDFVLETDEIALLHGRYDRCEFEKVVQAAGKDMLEDDKSNIVRAYNHFLESIDVEKINRATIRSNVQFVCIDLTEGEDEQQIFDTINSLGVRLTTAELLKNYFFNRENEDAFKSAWEDVFEPTDEKKRYWEQEIVTGRLKRSLIDLFFDAFLQINVQDRRFGVTAEDKLYYSRTSNLFLSYKDFISRYCRGDKAFLLEKMKPYARKFEESFNPELCNTDVTSVPGIERINVVIFGLKTSTLIPYVLYVRQNVDSPEEESRILGILESYVMRRMVVQATTKNYNKLFTSLILNEVLDAESLLASLKADDEATTYMPTDDEVRVGFENSKLYNLQAKGVLYLIESAIRPSMSGTQILGFNGYSLEHLMPKKWRNNWGSLDDEASSMRDKDLLTLGNLAIITHSLNASIRDASWGVKLQGKAGKDGLRDCAAGLATMKDVLEKGAWSETEIGERAEWLADRALSVWPVREPNA